MAGSWARRRRVGTQEVEREELGGGGTVLRAGFQTAHEKLDALERCPAWEQRKLARRLAHDAMLAPAATWAPEKQLQRDHADTPHVRRGGGALLRLLARPARARCWIAAAGVGQVDGAVCWLNHADGDRRERHVAVRTARGVQAPQTFDQRRDH